MQKTAYSGTEALLLVLRKNATDYRLDAIITIRDCSNKEEDDATG